MAKKISQENNNSDNIIIIRDVFKITRAFLEPCKDPFINDYPSCVRNIDANGDMILSEEDKKGRQYLISINDVIEIYDGKQFDLNNPKDSAWWEAIKYSPLIARSGRWEKDANGKYIIDGDARRYGLANFYVEMPGVEASKNVSKEFKVYEAIGKIKDSSYEELVSKTRLLGNYMKDCKMSDIQHYLVVIAKENPDRIIEIYDSENASYELLVLEAVDRGVIVQNKGIFMYGTTQLGTNKNSVVDTLKNPKNDALRASISKEVYG